MRKGIMSLLMAGLLSLPSLGLAHETAIVPALQGSYAVGQSIPFSMVATHTFPMSDELEAASSMAASFEGAALKLSPNESARAYEGAVTLTKAGAAILHGHRLPELWSKTPRGWLKGGRDEHKNAVATYKYEKFAKTLLPVDGKSEGFDSIVGDSLEIVPVDNPLTAKVGDDIHMRFLFNGKAFTPTTVKATYAGFSDVPNAWAYFIEPEEDIVPIKVHHAGLWIVRIEHTDHTVADTHTAHNLRATLVFPVQ